MGIDLRPGLAFAKSQIAAGSGLPDGGAVFLSLADRDKPRGLEAARIFDSLGFKLVATDGTATMLEENGLSVHERAAKLDEGGEQQQGSGRDAIEMIEQGDIALVINTPRGRGPRADGAYIRRATGRHGVALLTTASAALAAAKGIADWRDHALQVRTLQEYHQGVFSQ